MGLLPTVPALKSSSELLSRIAFLFPLLLRKEVAHIHVGDSALAELCKWDCEVGGSDLFPFDVSKRCEEIHKTRRLGRPTSRPFRTAGPRKVVPNRFLPRRHAYPPPARARTSKPFLGQRCPRGQGHMCKGTSSNSAISECSCFILS
ncbi:hypothetical protein E2C01_017723 [Portunus trituberculatus]|uniref:Uncharacterized protein n=1 Tax=Portunus trituberculatus TaxID=210409 RepID=A0A5B7DTN4_PORTR|nr:hypothetical protein [Portunus trituberculatus]